MPNRVHTGRQFLRFCIVGVANTLIDVSLYILLTRLLGLEGGFIYIAKGCSFAVATLNSFFLNRFWTFRREGQFQWSELLKFYMAAGSGIFINVGIHLIDVGFLGINDLVSAFIAAAFTAVWGFALVKYFVFN